MEMLTRIRGYHFCTFKALYFLLKGGLNVIQVHFLDLPNFRLWKGSASIGYSLSVAGFHATRFSSAMKTRRNINFLFDICDQIDCEFICHDIFLFILQSNSLKEFGIQVFVIFLTLFSQPSCYYFRNLTLLSIFFAVFIPCFVPSSIA